MDESYSFSSWRTMVNNEWAEISPDESEIMELNYDVFELQKEIRFLNNKFKTTNLIWLMIVVFMCFLGFIIGWSVS